MTHEELLFLVVMGVLGLLCGVVIGRLLWP